MRSVLGRGRRGRAGHLRSAVCGTALVLLVGTGSPTEIVGQQTVYVAGAERGQGVLRGRGAACFVLTPLHVVEDRLGPVEIVGSAGRRARASLERAYEPDLAVLRIDDPSGFSCEEWFPLNDFEQMLEGQSTGFLAMREIDGSRSRLPVNLTGSDSDGEYTFVRPSEAGRQIEMTMSGASLVVNGAFSGLLLARTEQDEGRVYQLDDLMRLSEPFFGAGSDAVEAEASLAVADAQAILGRAVEMKTGSSSGQVEALETLLARGHDMVGAELSGILLADADLSGGGFSEADLAATDLTRASLTDADLSGADLRFATLDSVDLSGAVATRIFAPFVEARGAILRNAELTGANLLGADLRDADLTGADLRGAALVFADLRGAVLDGADLTHAYLDGSVVESASFDRTTIHQTSLIGAAAAGAPLSEAQIAGACRHSPAREGADRRRYISWRIQLIERWPSDRFSTGFEFDARAPVGGAFDSFGDTSLPLCEGAPDLARGYHAWYPDDHRYHVDRSYLSRSGRNSEFRERVEARLDFLKEHLVPENILRDEARVDRWISHVEDSTATAEPDAPPYLDGDLLLVLLLGSGFLDPEEVDWATLARGRLAYETRIRTRLEGDFSRSRWGPIFPPDIAVMDVTGEVVDRYRRWTLDRAREVPERIWEWTSWLGTLRSVTTVVPVYRETRYYQDRSIQAALEAAGIPMTNTREANDPMGSSAFAELRGTDAQQDAVLVYPHAVHRYHVEVPPEIAALEGDGLRMFVELTLDSVERLPGVSPDLPLLRVRPGTVRLVRGDEEVWRGEAVLTPPRGPLP